MAYGECSFTVFVIVIKALWPHALDWDRIPPRCPSATISSDRFRSLSLPTHMLTHSYIHTHSYTRICHTHQPSGTVPTHGPQSSQSVPRSHSSSDTAGLPSTPALAAANSCRCGVVVDELGPMAAPVGDDDGDGEDG